jgi:hypothetical protein
MAIPVLPSGIAGWDELVRREADTGEIPLPAVESIVLDGTSEPAVTLIAPGLVPGGSHVFVDVGRMPPADRVTLETLLALLKDESGLPSERITAVQHSGGLAYELVGPGFEPAAQWEEIPPPTRPVLWSILHTIAELGVRYPDREASTPQVVRESSLATADEELARLAALLRSRNSVDQQIAELVGRPAQIGHIGEYIAARVFDIELNQGASTRGHDGFFRSGPLAGRSVNVKWHPKHDRLLNMSPELLADYYLVVTGPYEPPGSSRGRSRPLVISAVYLFDCRQLLEVLRDRGTKIGIATSVPSSLWEAAELYPELRNPVMPMSDEQRRRLGFFASPAA